MWGNSKTDDLFLNLKGFIVGNGVTDFGETGFPSYPETMKFFNLIPESLL